MATGGVRSESDDVVALWRLQSAYADVVTRRAWPELIELFRPEAPVHIDTVTAPTRTLVGAAELGEFIAGAIERYDYFAFVILNSVVDIVDETGARGRVFMSEIRHEPDPDRWHTAYGVYQDDYRLVGGRWWFARRDYRSIARTGPEPAVFGLPDGLGPLGR